MKSRLAFILALSLSVLLYRGFDAWSLIRGGRSSIETSVELQVRNGAFTVQSVRVRDYSGQPTVAARAGLRAEDELVAIVTADGTRYDLVSLGSAGDALRAVRANQRWTVIVRRVVAGHPSELHLEMSPPRSAFTASALLLVVYLVIPLTAVATALLITFLKPDDRLGFLASLLFLAFSSIFGSAFWLLPASIRGIAATIQTALAASFPYLFFRFFLVFPSPSVIDRRLPWLKRALAVPAMAVVVVSVALIMTALRSLEAAEQVGRAIGGRWASGAYELVTFSLLGLGLVSLGTQFLAAPTPGDRRRVGVLLAGVLGGFVPFLATVAYFWARTDVLPLWLLGLVVPTLLLFPLSFIYAVVRHRVLGVPVILRRGVRYALVSRGFLAVEVVAVFLALFFGVGPLLAAQFPDAGSGAIAATNAVATLAAVAGVDRLNRRLRPVLDRRFFRHPYNPQAVLTDLGLAMKAQAIDPHQLAQAVAERVSAALHAGTTEVLMDVARPLSPDRSRAGEPGRAFEASPRVFACQGWVTLDRVSGRPRTDAAHPPALELAANGPLLEAATPARSEGLTVFELDPTDTRAWFRQLGRGTAHSTGDLAEFDRLAARQARLIVPLSTQEGVLGWLVLGDRLSEEAYSQEDRAFVGAVSQQAAIALDYATLIGQVAEQEAMRRELDIARTVQAGLFPQHRPRVPSLDYDGLCRSAQEVGGDYYDFIEVGPGQLGLAIGDISGKGVSAALLMASLQALLRSRAPGAPTGLDALTLDINRLMLASTDPSKFATLFYSVYDAATRTLTYVNAGHNPPMLWRGSADVDRLAPTGPALGLMAHVHYVEAEARLEPGNLLVMFTDGVSEAMNGDGDEYGEERLLACVTRHRAEGATAVRDAILADVGRFVGAAQPHDDVTLVVARVM